MKKAFKKRLTALAAALCLIVCMMPVEVNADEADTVKYVALGDSITRGYGLDDPEIMSFPKLISDEQGYSIVNYGTDGATSETLLESLSDKEVAADVASADIITITIGGNDMMGALYSYIAAEWNSQYPGGEQKDASDINDALENKNSNMLIFALGVIDGFTKSEEAEQAVAAFTQNLGGIIEEIREANTDVLLFVATQYNPYKWLPDQCNDSYKDNVEKIADIFDSGVSVLNDVINSGAQSGAYVSVDVYGAFNESETDLSNAKYSSTLMGSWVIPEVDLDFHPNEEGHEAIAETMIAAINTTVQTALEKAVKATEALGTITADQKDVSSTETAQAWVAGQIQSIPATGLSVSGALDKFVPAAAGTADNPAGTDGSFDIIATFGLAGQSHTVTIPVVIKATAYTTPDENEQQTDDDTAVKDTSSSPKTGDFSAYAPYAALMMAAAAAAAVAYRKISGRRV